MDQERSEIGVSPFRDPQEDALPAAGVLTGNEAHIGGKLAAVLEAKGIAHQSDENRGRQDSYTGNAHQPLADRVLLGILGNPAIKVFKLLVEPGEFGGHGTKRLIEKRRNPRVVRIVDQSVQFVFHLGGGDLQDDPVFGQNAPDMVDRGRPELDDKLSRPVQALKILRLFRLEGNRGN